MAENLILREFYDGFIRRFNLDQLTPVDGKLSLSYKQMIDSDVDFLCHYAKGKGWTIISLTLVANRLTRIPDFSSAFPNLEELILTENQLERIPNFVSLPKLKRLVLNINRLTQIPNFSGLPLLETLVIANNKLSEIPNFTHCPRLKRLDIFSNQLKVIPDFTLPDLEVLQISCNLLTQIPLFSGCPALVHIEAAKNLLTDFPNFHPMIKLLNLSTNKLTTVPDLDQPNLVTFYLHENQIQELPNFSRLPKLESLSLMSNRLKEVPDLSALKKLKYLYLNRNDLTTIPLFHTYLEKLMEIDVRENRLESFLTSKTLTGHYLIQNQKQNPEDQLESLFDKLTLNSSKTILLEKFLRKIVTPLSAEEMDEVRNLFTAIQA